MARVEAYLHAKFHLDPSNRLATVHERYRQDRQDRQRTDSIGRTVLQTVAQKARVTYDLRKYYFTNRAVNIWNSLPNHVVLSDTVNMFKSRQHQDVIYDFKAEIHGTGSRSCY